MAARTAGWRLALRLARREVRRSRGRSALIVGMIALPVLGLSAADVVIRTADLALAEVADRTLGAADLRTQLVAAGPVEQDPGAFYEYRFEGEPAYGDRVTGLPAGSGTTPVEEGSVAVRTVAGETTTFVVTLDADSPLTTGLTRVLDGRAPTADGEVAISPALAERTGSGVGQQVRLGDGTAYDVVGLAVLPDLAGGETLIAPPGTVEFIAYSDGPETSPVFLVDLPAGADAAAVGDELNAAGYAVQLRDWILDPPPAAVDSRDAELLVGLTTVTVGLALLQVVLLAGAAFAVGARRQRRALGLYAATGATPRDVGRSVLAGGVVLGVVAAVVGLALGLALAWPLRVVIEDQLGVLYADWHVRPLDLAAIAGLGVLTGVLSALLPARAATRQDPLLALLQRPDPPRSGRRLTGTGLGLAALGLLVTVYGATRSPVSYPLILGGAVAVELGFVLCAPALVGAAGRLAGRLPVPLRLALRDAERHRNRSGPAVAAVMAALAGCVAVSIFFVSQDAEAERTYLPLANPGQVVLYPSGPEALEPQLRADVAAALPGAELVEWQNLAPACGAEMCTGSTGVVSADGSRFANLVLADPPLLDAAYGAQDPAAVQALGAGQVIVLGDGIVSDGSVQGSTYDEQGVERVLRDLPAYALPTPSGYLYALALISPEAAAGAGLVPQGNPTYVLDRATPPTDAELERLTELSADSSVFTFEVEQGYDSPAGPVLLALLGASVVVVLGATAISTGLAAADGRADLATLAAVGATPRTRRVLAMAQAAVVAFLGAVLGALAGFVPAAALVQTLDDWPLTIPWAVLGAIIVVVPLLAAACAGLFTRSRLPMVRRTA